MLILAQNLFLLTYVILYSPDNFIITTDIDGAADNNKIRWDKITDAENAKCIKIDHESMIKWQKKFSYIDKPMKKPFMAPEVNDKKHDEEGNELEEYEEFDAEKANIYQFGATFIYVLYGQLKDYDQNGDEYWKSLPSQGRGSWKKINWSPKVMVHQGDMVWLAKCVDKNPKKRLSYDQLRREIRGELLEYKPPSKSKNRIDPNRVQPMSSPSPSSSNGHDLNRIRSRMQHGHINHNRHGFRHGDNVTIIVNPGQRTMSNRPHIMMDPHQTPIPHQQYTQQSPHPLQRQQNLLRNNVNAMAQRGRHGMNQYYQQQMPQSQAQYRQNQFMQQRQRESQQRMAKNNNNNNHNQGHSTNNLIKARNRMNLQQFNNQFHPQSSQGQRRMNINNGGFNNQRNKSNGRNNFRR